MEKAMIDVAVYANMIIDQLIAIKDRHRDVLNSTEVDTLNNAANLIEVNIKELKNV